MTAFVPPAPLRTAVLLVLFNRPEATLRVLKAIRAAKPPRLYIAADGPRPTHPDDTSKCREAREMTKYVDWPCKVITLFREQNLGCGLGPAKAYDWFFSQEEEGIILEDDCVPDPSFFWFCEEMLEKYRHDNLIMHITGTNFLGEQQRSNGFSYRFSIHPHEWGWASWRRAWQLYDFEIKSYPEVLRNHALKDVYGSWLEYLYRMSKFRSTYGRPEVTWWDYQWNFALQTHQGLAIVPAVNLVRNIGFGPDATHTVSTSDARGNNQAGRMKFPLWHPPVVAQDKTADKKFFQLQMRRLLKRKVFSLLGIKGYSTRG